MDSGVEPRWALLTCIARLRESNAIVRGVDQEERRKPFGLIDGVLWVVLVLGLMVLAGRYCGSPSQSPSRTDAPSPNVASTTTNRCQGAAADLGESARLGLLEAEWFAESLEMGDMSGAQAHYDNTTFLVELAIIQTDAFLDRCGSYARSEGIYTDLQEASANLESELARVQRICRLELTPRGFDC